MRISVELTARSTDMFNESDGSGQVAGTKKAEMGMVPRLCYHVTGPPFNSANSLRT